MSNTIDACLGSTSNRIESDSSQTPRGVVRGSLGSSHPRNERSASILYCWSPRASFPDRLLALETGETAMTKCTRRARAEGARPWPRGRLCSAAAVGCRTGPDGRPHRNRQGRTRRRDIRCSGPNQFAGPDWWSSNHHDRQRRAALSGAASRTLRTRHRVPRLQALPRRRHHHRRRRDHRATG